LFAQADLGHQSIGIARRAVGAQQFASTVRKSHRFTDQRSLASVIHAVI